MGKTKSAKHRGADSTGANDVKVSNVRSGGITKPLQTPKVKSKGGAKDVAVKVSTKSKKDESSDSPDSSDDDEDMIDPSTGSSEAGSPVVVAKSNGKAEANISEGSDSDSDDENVPAKTNGEKKLAAAQSDPESSESSESAASDDGESDGESDDEETEAADAKKPGPQVTAGKEDDSGSEDDSSDASSGSEAETKPRGKVDAKKPNGKLEKAGTEGSSDSESDAGANSSEEESSDDGSDDAEDSASESEEEAPASKKRKAEEVSTPIAKKSKTDSSVNDDAKKNLFVGQLSWAIDEEWLQREFAEFGEIENVNIIQDRQSGRSKGFGYVKFVDAESGVKAQKAMHRKELDGREINVDFNKPRDAATPREDRSQRYGDAQPSAESSTLFVANIAFGAGQEELRKEFSKHGDVIGARLPTDRETGEVKGYGYVDFSSVEEAKKAFEKMTGAKIMGRPIRLDYSQPRPERSFGDSPGGFRGGRGGDRGRGRGRGRGGFDRGGRGGARGGRGGFESKNRGGFGDFKGKKMNL